MTKKLSYRFADYTEPWEQRKLGDVGETYTGLSGKTKEDFGHGEGKFITYVNVFNNPLTDLYGLDSVEIDDKQRRVQYGDVLFTTSSETPEDVGLSSVWLGREDNVYLNSFCFGYRPKKDIFDLYYLAFVLRSFSVRREFMLLAQGISRFNISKTKVMNMSINVPSLPEQTAIGSFFQDIDQLISLQQRKLEVLKEQKKTYLKLLFPAKGQTKPALRFAGFEDEWKEVKLGEIGEIQTGNTPPTNEEDNYEKNGFPWVTPTDINSLVLHTTSKQLSEVGKSKARIAKSGSILVTCIASIGKNTLVRTDSAFNQQINSLTPSEKYSSYFLLTQSEIWSRYMLSVAGAGTMQIINKSDFSNIKTMVPSLPEQEAIGSFFQDLDKAIAKQEEKVNQLKESKQTLLRKMFI